MPVIVPRSLTQLRFGRKKLTKTQEAKLEKISKQMKKIGCNWRSGIGWQLDSKFFDSKRCRELKKSYKKIDSSARSILMGFGRRRSNRRRSNRHRSNRRRSNRRRSNRRLSH